VSVILPAYNEASNLVEVVPRLLGVLEHSAPITRCSSSTTAATTARRD
jgi:hypothetical protein